MRKVKSLAGGDVKLRKPEEKQRIAAAYAHGTMNREMKFEFPFEQEAWEKGRLDDIRIKEEIRKGER